MSLSGVSKTAILTLRARADEHARADRVFEDPHAVEWFAKMEWPRELDGWYAGPVPSYLAFRADELDRVVASYIAAHPGAAVVELGCGLSSRCLRIGGASSWIDLDLPEVIAARESLGVRAPRHRHIACSVLDRSWLEEVPPGALIVAEGLFYYLPRPEVDALFADMRRGLAGSAIAFDVLGDMDFDAAVRNSTSAGTPMLWKVDRPFSRNLAAFGLTPLPEWDLEARMQESIDRYWPRFGHASYLAVKVLAKIRFLAEKRSGVLVGRFG